MSSTPAERALAGLDEHQREAAIAPLSPLAVIAGPGSGKTKTVVARIGYIVSNGVRPESVLALTHTTKAAGELRERLTHAGVTGATCSTVHAAAWRQVRSLWRESGIAVEPVLVSSSWTLVRDAVSVALGRAKAQTETITDAASEIEWGRAWLLEPSAYPAHAAKHGRTSSLDAQDIARVWETFNEVKERAGVLDFADVLELATRMMQNPEIAARVQAKWGVFFLDEYQDVDNAQQRLVDSWIGDGEAVTVTGDPEQAIFGFKGGDPTLLTGFANQRKNARVIHLTNNYRSTPEIVGWVNALTLEKRPALVGKQASGAAPVVLTANDEREEEERLVGQIREWQRSGLPLQEMAVLYRFNATAARVEAALSQAGIPYQTTGQTKFFERPEVRNVLVPFGQEARQNPDSPGVAVLERAAASTGWIEGQPPNGAGAARQRWEAVKALVDLVRESHAGMDAKSLLNVLQQRARDAHDVPMNGVTLATIHAAKGLEWDAVWVVGAVEGQIPSAYATTKQQIAEEQHLLYVAVSRARKKLVVSWSQRRQNNWRADRSRFLDVLAPRPVRKSLVGKGPAASRGKQNVANKAVRYDPEIEALFQCARCGRRLSGAAARLVKRCSAGCLDGEPLLRHAQLEQWRAAAAERLGVDASKVASDRALFSAAAEGSSAGVRGFAPEAGAPPF